MGLYEDRVLPRILNKACGGKLLEPLRRRVCAGLAGDIVEIGFGSGLNIPFYPAAVISVAAVEPCDVSWRLAGERLRASNVPVLRSGLDGQSLPFEDGSFDAALSTWTLCTIPDVAVALSELRRVLRSGGTSQFLEHGLALDECAALAATPRPVATADSGWMPPDLAYRGPTQGRGFHGQGSRCLLRGRHHKGLWCRFARDRIPSLVPARRAVRAGPRDQTCNHGA
jgi:SAM-dependent methyltransferase